MRRWVRRAATLQTWLCFGKYIRERLAEVAASSAMTLGYALRCGSDRGACVAHIQLWRKAEARLAGGGRQQRHDLGVRAQAQHGHGVRARQRQRQQRDQLLLRALPVRRAAAALQRLRAGQVFMY